MFFRRKPSAKSETMASATSPRAETIGVEIEDAHDQDIPTEPRTIPARTSSAGTAHLIGPGCLKLHGGLPRWEPVQGQNIMLHPEYLERILLYGSTDATGSALRLCWRKGIQVVFLTPQGHEILGRLQPAGNCPNLPYLQHLAAADSAFPLAVARWLVHEKMQATVTALRYYQQQGKVTAAGDRLKQLERLKASADKAKSVNSLRGVEGTTAHLWFEVFATLLPEGWTFPGRQARPCHDPVNALLSLGYTLLLNRCQTLLAAADLDPLVGFLHEIHPGRPSLACDIMEPQRIALVDRLVLGILGRKRLSPGDFETTPDGLRLKSDPFRMFLKAFEDEFAATSKTGTHREQTQQRIDELIKRIRQRNISNA